MKRALSYYHDRQSLADLKAKLQSQQQTAPLFDMPRFTRDLEATLEKMWEKYQKNPNSNIRAYA